MQIPNELPQFTGEKVLIIVTGRQNAVFYSVADGVLERLDAFEVPNPRYSDNEGAFGKRGRGTMFRPGTAQEFDIESLIRDFLREFKTRIKRLPDCSKLFLFAPAQLKNKVESALPVNWKPKIEAVIEGNFYYRHPTYLLKKLHLKTIS